MYTGWGVVSARPRGPHDWHSNRDRAKGDSNLADVGVAAVHLALLGLQVGVVVEDGENFLNPVGDRERERSERRGVAWPG